MKVIDVASRIWYPCQKIKQPRLPRVCRAEGCYIELETGERLIDATCSWWCKSLGHQHPQLKQALLRQADQFEHVMIADLSYLALEQLSGRLTAHFTQLQSICYASDGACAVEMAMKMSLLARYHAGQSERRQFVALSGSYHGETLASLQVTDLEIYKHGYPQDLLLTNRIEHLPYVNGPQDPLWLDCGEYWLAIEHQLECSATQATAIIIEPIVQAANGMRILSQDLLSRLRCWCDQHDVHLIFDEIFTGFMRTGRLFACQHACVEPDFLCLGKALTAGWMAMSAVLIAEKFSELQSSFLHSHTYTGNALAAAVANEHVQIVSKPTLQAHVAKLEHALLHAMQVLASESALLERVRAIGAMVAADVSASSPLTAQQICHHARKQGVLMRPLANTVYWLLPINAPLEVVAALQQATRSALMH